MRVVLVAAIAACGGGADPAAPAPTPPPPPAVTATVASSTPPLGPLAAGPATPTVERVAARSCTATPPIELGAIDGKRGAMAAFSRDGGLVAWSPRPKRLAVRPVDRTGAPTGAAHELDVPADLDHVEGLRALDGHYLAFLREDDFSGESPIVRLYALVLATDGTAIGAPLEVATGSRGIVDAISPAASHGVVVYAGATPATHVDQLRVVTVYVAPDGKIRQATRDFPDPTPGTRALPRFSFSADHAAIVLPEHVIVDGELHASASDPAIERMTVAPAFTGDRIPVMGITADGKRRYGTIDLAGARHFDRTAEAATAAPRAPFEQLAEWVLVTHGSAVDAVVLGAEIPLAFPDLSSGPDTQIVWTGDRALVLYAAGAAVRIAPLPCR